MSWMFLVLCLARVSFAVSQTLVIELKNPLDLSTLPKQFKNPQEKQKKIASLLEAHTRNAIDKMFPFLKTEEGVEEVTPLWISHSVRIKADSRTIQKLTSWGSSQVEMINLEKLKEVSEFQEEVVFNSFPYYTRTFPPRLASGVLAIGASELWRHGFKGQGVITAVIDTGANVNHPDLNPNLWVNSGETGIDSKGRDKSNNGIDDDGNGYVDDVVGYNFDRRTTDVSDDNGHGTQTAGIIAGNGKMGITTGVAPETKLMVLKACCTATKKVAESNLWEAMQYAAKNGARVISMSLSVKHISDPSYSQWRKAGEALLAMGVTHVNSAGNKGRADIPYSVGAPGSNPPAWFHPLQTPLNGSKPTSMITVGAVDPYGRIVTTSSRGPSTWEDVPEYQDFPWEGGEQPGLIRPDICAPSGVPSLTIFGNQYTTYFGGTSAATPHVGGGVALLLSAFPDATVEEITESLQMSARQTSGRFTNDCGAGRLNLFMAYKYLAKKRYALSEEKSNQQ